MKEIKYSKQAARLLTRLQPRTASRIDAAIGRIAANETEGMDIKPLAGSPSFRLRIGDWRVIFKTTRAEVLVAKIAPRGEAYKP